MFRGRLHIISAFPLETIREQLAFINGLQHAVLSTSIPFAPRALALDVIRLRMDQQRAQRDQQMLLD